MELSDRRGTKRMLEDYGADPSGQANGPGLPRWYRNEHHQRLQIDAGLRDLGSQQFALTPELATHFPHLASAILPSENDLGYQAAAPYLPPPSQHLQSAGPQFLPPPGLLQQSPLQDYQLASPGFSHSAPSLNQLPHPSATFPYYVPPVANQEGQISGLSEYVPLHSAPFSAGEGYADVPPPGIVLSERTPFAQRRPSPPRSAGYQRRKSLPGVLTNDGTKEENGGKQSVENPVEGMIFGCNKKTKEECKRLQLFGLPATHRREVLRVIPGSKLFLFNYDSKHLSGVFEATCHGAMDILPQAFRSFGSFPAQVKIKRVMKVPSITMDKLKEAIPEIFYNEKKFKYELSRSQVDKLVELLVAAKEVPTK